MTLFWTIAAGLVVLATSFVIPPLLRFKPKEEASSDDLNLKVIKQQLIELKIDLDSGDLDQEQYDNARHDLEKELLADMGSGEDGRAGEVKSGRWAMVAIPIALPVIALPLYLYLGTPDIIPRIGEAATTAQAQGSDHTAPDQGMADMTGLVEKLAERMEKDPGNPEGWKMLGRSYMAINRLDDSIKAYERAYQLDPQDVDTLLGYASSLAKKNNNAFYGLPAQLIDMAYNLEPDNTNIHWLKGNAHYQEGKFAKAVAYWEKVFATLQPGSEEAAVVSEYLKDARSRVPEGAVIPEISSTTATQAPSAPKAAAAGKIRVEVTLDPALRDKVKDTDKVFIFARATQGPRMPLAAVRRQVQDLPVTIVLDDRMAMAAELVLSNYSEVMVEARVSKSGDPVPQSGDIEGRVGPIKPGQEETVQISINTVHP